MKHLFPLVALLLALSTPSFAQTVTPVPSTMNFQGRLAKPDGTPVPDTSAQTLTFSLYDNASRGSLLWTQTTPNITVHNGAFAAKLDFSTGFAAGKTFAGTFATAGTSPYLQIQVGTDTPLFPRQPFQSSAYAFVASTALTVPDGSITAAKLAAGANTPGGNAGGDLTGTYPTPSLITDSILLPKVSGGVLSVGQSATPFVDQSQTLVTYNLNYGITSWQSFTPSQTQALAGIDLFIGNLERVASTMTLSVYAGQGTGGTLLYSAPFSYSGATGPQHFNLTGTPPFLQGNAQYTFSVTETGGQTQYLAIKTVDVYAGGRSGYAPDADYYFQTYARFANVVTLQGSLSVSNATQSVERLRLTGQEFYQAGHTDTDGIAFLLGVNRPANRQLWIADSASLTPNATNATLRLSPNGTYIDALATDGVTPLPLTLQHNGGNVGIGMTPGAYKLDVAGQVRANGTVLTSDARYKTNVHTLDNALEDILQLRGVSYDWDRQKWPVKNFPAGRQIGFIAQEVERIFPELVTTDSDGYKAVAYQNAVPILVEAIKTLKTQVDALKADNAELKKQNAAIAELAREIAELKKERKP